MVSCVASFVGVATSGNQTGACIENMYLELAEEIAQAALGPWDPDRYRNWRFSEQPLGSTSEGESARGSTENGWLQLALRIRDPFLSCYRGIYGPVGLYWLLPLLGAMYLHKQYGKTPPADWPRVHTVPIRCCPKKSNGVLLCRGVRLPCGWAPL